ncbi:MAG: DMT family transporter [Desulfopila sp.]
MPQQNATSADNNQLTLGSALLTILLCLLFGANPVAMKMSLTGIGVFTSTALRFAISTVALACWAAWSGRRLAISAKQLGQMCVLALIFFFQLSFFTFGLDLSTASHGALISNFLPFLIMLLAHFLLPDDRITPQKLIGLVLGFIGVALLFRDSLSLTSSAFIGDLLLLAAVGVWSCNVIMVKRIISGYSSLQITLYPMLLAAPLFFFAGLIFDKQMIFDLSPYVISGMVYQSIVTAAFGFAMWNWLMQRYGATVLHSFVFLMPISGVLLGVLMLGDPLTADLTVSIVLVVLGLIVINWRGPKRLVPPPAP